MLAPFLLKKSTAGFCFALMCSQSTCLQAVSNHLENQFRNLYWREVHSSIERIMELEIPFSSPVLYLGDISEEITGANRYLINILIVASKKAITRMWLQRNPPTNQDWQEIRSMDNLTFVLCLQGQKFLRNTGGSGIASSNLNDRGYPSSPHSPVLYCIVLFSLLYLLSAYCSFFVQKAW